MSLTELIAGYLARGAIQLSRKYRHIGVPPELAEGECFLDRLRTIDPKEWTRLEGWAREHLIRYHTTALELSFEEFNEWLRQTDRAPSASPPEPFQTWGEYWRAKKGSTINDT